MGLICKNEDSHDMAEKLEILTLDKCLRNLMEKMLVAAQKKDLIEEIVIKK